MALRCSSCLRRPTTSAPATREFLREIWPNILAALEWIDVYGDQDRDGFVEYARQTDHGLVQQGWKDSGDSVFYSDGRLAAGPIALCEVQAYVYAAKNGIATVAADLGDHGSCRAASGAGGRTAREVSIHVLVRRTRHVCAGAGWRKEAMPRAQFQCRPVFVLRDRQRRAISLHQRGASFAGILSLAGECERLLRGERRYNPMSYHNGSMWPHDNALIALGSLRRSDKELALRITSGLLDLSSEVMFHRLPELICGFGRRPGKGPTLYPVACSPQAWAAGSVFMLLQACLGLEIRASESRIYLHHAAYLKSCSIFVFAT